MEIEDINTKISNTTAKILHHVQNLDSLSQPNPAQNEISESIRDSFRYLELDNKEKALVELSKWANGRQEAYTEFDDTFIRRIQTFQRLLDDKTTDQFQELSENVDKWDSFLTAALANVEMFHMNFDRFWSKMPRSTDNDNGPFNPADSKLEQKMNEAGFVLEQSKHRTNYIEKKRLMKLREQHYLMIIDSMQQFVNRLRDDMEKIQANEMATKKALSEIIDEHKNLEEQRKAQEMIISNLESKNEERKKKLESRTIQLNQEELSIEPSIFENKVNKEEKKEEEEELNEDEKNEDKNLKESKSIRERNIGGRNSMPKGKPIVFLKMVKGCIYCLDENGKEEICTENFVFDENGETNEENILPSNETKSETENNNIKESVNPLVAKIFIRCNISSVKNVFDCSPDENLIKLHKNDDESTNSNLKKRKKSKKSENEGPNGYTAVMGNNLTDPNDKYKKLLEEGIEDNNNKKGENDYEYYEDDDEGEYDEIPKDESHKDENEGNKDENNTNISMRKKSRKVHKLDPLNGHDESTQTDFINGPIAFDQNGNPIQFGNQNQMKQIFDGNGIYSKQQQILDKNGNPLSQFDNLNQQQFFDQNGNPVNFLNQNLQQQVIDQNGNVIQNVNQIPLQLFDQDGNPIEKYDPNQKVFDKDGNPIDPQHIQQIIDQNGQPMIVGIGSNIGQQAGYNDQNGSFSQQFDQNGNPIISQQRQQQKQPIIQMFDKDGNIIQFNPNQQFYDADGNLVNFDPNNFNQQQQLFDENGNPIYIKIQPGPQQQQQRSLYDHQLNQQLNQLQQQQMIVNDFANLTKEQKIQQMQQIIEQMKQSNADPQKIEEMQRMLELIQNNHGQMSEEEIQQIQQMMSEQIQLQQQGLLQIQRSNQNSSQLNSQQINQMLQVMSQNGQISEEEMQQIMQIVQKNGGQLSAQEMMQILQQIQTSNGGQIDMQQVQQMMNSMISNNNNYNQQQQNLINQAEMQMDIRIPTDSNGLPLTRTYSGELLDGNGNQLHKNNDFNNNYNNIINSNNNGRFSLLSEVGPVNQGPFSNAAIFQNQQRRHMNSAEEEPILRRPQKLISPVYQSIPALIIHHYEFVENTLQNGQRQIVIQSPNNPYSEVVNNNNNNVTYSQNMLNSLFQQRFRQPQIIQPQALKFNRRRAGVSIRPFPAFPPPSSEYDENGTMAALSPRYQQYFSASGNISCENSSRRRRVEFDLNNEEENGVEQQQHEVKQPNGSSAVSPRFSTSARHSNDGGYKERLLRVMNESTAEELYGRGGRNTNSARSQGSGRNIIGRAPVNQMHPKMVPGEVQNNGIGLYITPFSPKEPKP